jgi:RNA polymerase sigma factor (TIGR02999 family)
LNEPNPDPGEITRLLQAWGAGDRTAYERLFPIVYGELRRLAEREFRREAPGHTLQPTALVHEAYVELLGQRDPQFANRKHFLAVAAFVMRRLLAEHARARKALKRGGGAVPVPLDGLERADDGAWEEVAAVDQALEKLRAVDPRAADVVVLRYFGGLSHEEIGEALGVSIATVKRDWTAARSWLRRELSA